MYEMRVFEQDELIYLAGVIDCDGNIGIHSNKGKAKNIRVNVVNTDTRLILWCKETFGGHTYESAPSDPEKHKARWTWEIVSNQAANLLHQVYPLLKLKRAQAEIALAFQLLLKRGTNRLNPSELEKRQVLKEAMTVLNHKGPEE